MTLKELDFFYNLCENSHISKLSKKQSISQSAISLSIKSLEKKLGEPLFDRIGKKLVLNDRGRLFKAKTYKSFLHLKDAQTFFKEEKISGDLHIASSKTIGNFILPQIEFDFLSKYQNVTIKNDIKNSSQIIELVKQGSLDMGFIEIDCSDEEIIKEFMGKDDLIIVSSDKKLETSLYIDELFSKKWILREEGSGTREMFLDGIGELANELDVFMEYQDFAQIKELLMNNSNVVTCISRVAVQKELKNRELREIGLKNITIKRDFSIIFHKNKYKSKLLESFKQFALDDF